MKLVDLLPDQAKKEIGRVYSNPFATSFKSPQQIEEDMDTPPKYSDSEAKLHIDADIKKMSKVLGKASQQVIKIMMDGVKSGRYDALDIQRGIKVGPFNRTHEGERPFMRMLWRKVRDGFRRYSPKGKLR